MALSHMRILAGRALTGLPTSRLIPLRHFFYSRPIMSASPLDELNASIREQNSILKTLRDQNAASSAIDAAHKKLGDLKKSLGQMMGRDKEKGEGKKERLLLKTAKGTRDFGPAETACRTHIESTVRDVFTSYGGTGLDTPVFERKDILAGKYGEDAKLIFDLADQGGEQLALRYDHTVSTFCCSQ